MWRYGWGYANGKLSAFGTRDIVVLRGWPAPLAWRRTRSKPWQPTRKYADGVFRSVLMRTNVLPDRFSLAPDHDTIAMAPGEDPPPADHYRVKILPKEIEMACKFLHHTPEDVLSELSRHTDRHWHLYCLFARCPGAVELAKDHPVLAYALASCWIFHKPEPTHPMRAIRSLLRKPVPAIWEWLGFPVNPIALGMYGWLEAAGLTIKRLFYYRAAMQDLATQEHLFNLGPLEWNVLELAVTPWMARMVTVNLILEMARHTTWDLNEIEEVKEALMYIRMMEKNYEILELPRFNRPSQVIAFRARLQTMSSGDFLMRKPL